jgi:hypothetical protein
MLDWAANLLTSQKAFARRMIASDHEAGEKSASMKQLVNIMRRVYRIFAHAWFQHRETFWKLESRTGLYVFFKTVCDTYDLISTESSIIPPEAEAGEPVQPIDLQEAPQATSETGAEESEPQDISPEPVNTPTDLQHALSSSNATVPTNTTKRHRQTLSSDSDTIATVLEENEEDYQHGSLPSGHSIEAPEPSGQSLPAQDDHLIENQATHSQPASENGGIPPVATSEEYGSKSEKQTEALATSVADADSARNVEHEKEHDPESLQPETVSQPSKSELNDTQAGEPSKSD